MSETTTAPQNGAQHNINEPVNRSRRSHFIFFVVGICLVASIALTTLAGFGIITAQIKLIEVLIQALLSLASISTVAYVGGSSIDYNGGVGNMFRRNQTRDPYEDDGHAKG